MNTMVSVYRGSRRVYRKIFSYISPKSLKELKKSYEKDECTVRILRFKSPNESSKN